VCVCVRIIESNTHWTICSSVPSQTNVPTIFYSTAHGGDQTYKRFGSRDLTIFLLDLLSDGDSIYTRENLYEKLGTHVKTCLICTGTPVKTCWKFWQS